MGWIQVVIYGISLVFGFGIVYQEQKHILSQVKALQNDVKNFTAVTVELSNRMTKMEVEQQNMKTRVRDLEKKSY
jgi:hypothetical protein